MPKKAPVVQETEPEEIVASEEQKQPAPGVEVDLEPAQAPDPNEKLKNQMFYEMRQLEKKMLERQRQMIEEISQRTKPAPAASPPVNDEFEEEVERVAQVDWKKAIDMRAERIAEKKLEEKLKAREEKEREDLNRASSLRVEAKGRDRVVKEFPNIMDESSTEFKAYMEIYNREVSEDPTFVYNPRKHDIILPELKEKLKDQVVENPEIERLKRVAAASASPSRPSSSNKIVLTQEEIEMCKRSGIPVEAYARTKKLGPAGFKEGVVIDE